MKEDFRRWWPALPALLILYVGGSSFIAKYPSGAGNHVVRRIGSQGPDSLLAFVKAGLESPAGNSGGNDSARIASSRENPFRPIHQPKPASEIAAAAANKPPPPLRKFVLKGTVGTNVATITNNAGQKMIVKVGDAIDSAEVLSIEPNRVTLKDRAGKFDLMTEK